MTAHLIAIAVGPVQEFIAAARRTRDLWFGSHLLSAVSKAVAIEVAKHGTLIFPESTAAPNVANVILAELDLPDGTFAKDIAATAKLAALDCWAGYAKRMIEDPDIAKVIRNDPASDQGDIWNEQVGEVVEFYAAWVPQTGNYEQGRNRVMRLLAGRKNCRNFRVAPPHPGLPKSSLDGMRDTVLLGPGKDEDPLTYRNSWSRATRQKLRVRTGEQLDVIGVVKRAAGGSQSYPSVSRVAADPRVRGIEKVGGAAVLKALAAACDKVLGDVVHRLNTGAFPQYRAFPFEGTTLFRTRHHEWFEETEDAPKRSNGRGELPAWYGAVEEALGSVEAFAAGKKLGGEPNPYLAVIVADGDNMGKAIARLKNAGQHRAFSATLARFAARAKIIVEGEIVSGKVVNGHQGVLVYAGGDGAFAFVPVDRCLDCARALHDEFESLLKEWSETAGTVPPRRGISRPPVRIQPGRGSGLRDDRLPRRLDHAGYGAGLPVSGRDDAPPSEVAEQRGRADRFRQPHPGVVLVGERDVSRGCFLGGPSESPAGCELD